MARWRQWAGAAGWHQPCGGQSGVGGLVGLAWLQAAGRALPDAVMSPCRLLNSLARAPEQKLNCLALCTAGARNWHLGGAEPVLPNLKSGCSFTVTGRYNWHLGTIGRFLRHAPKFPYALTSKSLPHSPIFEILNSLVRAPGRKLNRLLACNAPHPRALGPLPCGSLAPLAGLRFAFPRRGRTHVGPPCLGCGRPCSKLISKKKKKSWPRV